MPEISFYMNARNDSPFLNVLPKGLARLGYVAVGKKDSFGRTRLPDQPTDPEEYDFSGHMLNIYADIMNAVSPESINDEYGFGLAGIEGLIYDWASDQWENWREVHTKLKGPTQWDRELTPEEKDSSKDSRKVTWSMGDYSR